jgi:hypothetical protein
MTCRRLTPEEIERSDAASRQWWLHVLTLGLIPKPGPVLTPDLDTWIRPDGMRVCDGLTKYAEPQLGPEAGS